VGKTELWHSAVLLFSVIISNISQILLKKSAQKKHGSLIKEYLNPYVITAYTIFVIATLTTIYAYKGIPLSWGAVLDSSGYFFISIFGMLFLGEKITYKKAISLCVIIAGIIVFSI
jgi:multidrug transporter EmrE-like cation transporter